MQQLHKLKQMVLVQQVHNQCLLVMVALVLIKSLKKWKINALACVHKEELIHAYYRIWSLNETGDAITPIKTGGTVIGIALAQSIHDYVENKDDQKYEVAKPAAIVKRGRIFVVAGGDIINGKPVKVDPTTQKFTTDGTVAVNGAVFKSNATADQLVEIEINLP